MAVEITEEFVWQNIPRRARDSHKGTFGTVLAVAGSAYYRGAALLAAEGALRTGAGIVTLASVEPVLAAAVARTPGRSVNEPVTSCPDARPAASAPSMKQTLAANAEKRMTRNASTAASAPEFHEGLRGSRTASAPFAFLMRMK